MTAWTSPREAGQNECVAGREPIHLSKWSGLPTGPYASVFVVVDGRGRVEAKMLLGEGSLLRIPESDLPLGINGPFSPPRE